ncbi:protein of unknown function [Acidithiobacillus ferrivorans]|uniref:Transposase n=1 Tax=Acidithiobacillus ferrivorans TaxID=160808 RepID=A0ABY1MPK6_9PROT|nr:protein of unknown function [Acidithiobacillus ferrivorans]
MVGRRLKTVIQYRYSSERIQPKVNGVYCSKKTWAAASTQAVLASGRYVNNVVFLRYNNLIAS